LECVMTGATGAAALVGGPEAACADTASPAASAVTSTSTAPTSTATPKRGRLALVRLLVDFDKLAFLSPVLRLQQTGHLPDAAS
jgi:hypothetical protein